MSVIHLSSVPFSRIQRAAGNAPPVVVFQSIYKGPLAVQIKIVWWHLRFLLGMGDLCPYLKFIKNLVCSGDHSLVLIANAPDFEHKVIQQFTFFNFLHDHRLTEERLGAVNDDLLKQQRVVGLGGCVWTVCMQRKANKLGSFDGPSIQVHSAVHDRIIELLCTTPQMHPFTIHQAMRLSHSL